jgi:hypothetical protein
MAGFDAAKKGAIRAAPAVGGSLFLGNPMLGAPIGGFAADMLSDGSSQKYTTAGVAVGVASLFAGGMAASAGGGGGGRVM